MSPAGKVGWGIIGCSRVADRRAAPVFARMDDAALVAVCSRDLSKASDFARRHGVSRAYDSLDELLADVDVQVVYISTPNALHADQTCRCLEAGKHVLVDKPMSLDARTAADMVETARRTGRLLAVAHQQRFHPANVHLMRFLDEGRLGKINLIRVQIAMWYPPQGTWRQDPSLAGGGVAMDLGPHALDLMLEVGGDIVRVDATLRNLQFPGPLEDFCHARLDFASGGIGLMDLSYCGHHYGGRVEVFGGGGSFASDGSLQCAATYDTWYRRGDATEEACREVSTTDCFQEAFEDFTDAVRHQGSPAVSMRDGLRVMKVIDAIYDSARSGRPMDVILS